MLNKIGKVTIFTLLPKYVFVIKGMRRQAKFRNFYLFNFLFNRMSVNSLQVILLFIVRGSKF